MIDRLKVLFKSITGEIDTPRACKMKKYLDYRCEFGKNYAINISIQ